jgi:Type IV secretory system Conjugative DNA transfer
LHCSIGPIHRFFFRFEEVMNPSKLDSWCSPIPCFFCRPCFSGTEPVDKDRLKPLIRVLVNMIVRISASGLAFEDGLPKATYKHRLLLMLDEFPALRSHKLERQHWIGVITPSYYCWPGSVCELAKRRPMRGQVNCCD